MVDIVFCGNEKVFDGVLTSILSILTRDPSRDQYRFTILTMDLTRLNPAYTPITDRLISFLEGIVQRYNPKSTVKKIDVTDLYEEKLGHSPNENNYCSPYTLLRLLIDLLPDFGDKALYLDADLMINQDIHMLWDYPLKPGVEFAGSNDHYGKYLIHPRYINAGVLLFNLVECRKTNLFAKARDLINAKKLIFNDQSALNRAGKKKQLLPQKFNDQKFLHKSTVIRHFSKRLFYLPYPHTDNIKQWHIEKVHKIFRYHQFDDVYEIYLKEKAAYEGK